MDMTVTRPWSFPGLQRFAYNLIVIDPPWPWQIYSEKGIKKTPGAQYKLMKMDELRSLQVGDLASVPTLLLLWGTIPMMDVQIDLMKHWGFKYQSAMMWHKVHPSGKTAMGLGYRVRSMVEPVLIGTIGSPKHKPFPGLFTGVRRAHSQKPEEFYQMVQEHCPLLINRADVYARVRRHGYDSFGDELDKFEPVGV